MKLAFSGSRDGKLRLLTSPALSSLSNTGASAAPLAGFRRTCAARSRGTAAVKRRRSGRIGRQGALARSRSQLTSAVKAGRTVKRKRCSVPVTIFGLASAPMPFPHTRRSALAFGSGRWQVSTRWRSACALSMRRAASNCARRSPPISRTPMRSPMPSTSHHALASTVLSTTAALRRSRKNWSSSTWLPSSGCNDSTAGPPVLKLNSVGPVSAAGWAAVPEVSGVTGVTGFHSGRTFSVQRVPGARASRKS